MADVSATPTTDRRHATASLPLLGFGAVLGSAALFGTLGPLSRIAYDLGVQPAAWVSWRGAIGLLTLLLIIAWRARSGAARVVRVAGIPVKARIALLTAAAMGFTLNLSMFFAFDRVTIALALLCFYTYPAMVAAVNVLAGRERLDGPRAVALALALVGMTMVVASQLDPASGIRVDGLGIAMALGAAVSQTVYVVVSRDGYHQVPTEQAIAVVMLVTTFGAALVVIVAGSAAALVPPIGEPGLIPLLLFTGIFAAAVPSLGFLYGIRAIGGLRAGILMLFEPVVGVALAAWLLGEALVPVQIVGAIAILTAAVILQRARPSGAPRDRQTAAVASGEA